MNPLWVGAACLANPFPRFSYRLLLNRLMDFLKRLRAQNPPIIARTTNDKVLLDPRTVLPEQEGALLVGLKNVINDF